MFTHWPVYALAGAGLGAEILNQAALHVGPLSISQPFLVIVDPVVSIALSVWVFVESFTADATRIAAGGPRLRRHVRGGDHTYPNRSGNHERTAEDRDVISDPGDAAAGRGDWS